MIDRVLDDTERVALHGAIMQVNGVLSCSISTSSSTPSLLLLIARAKNARKKNGGVGGGGGGGGGGGSFFVPHSLSQIAIVYDPRRVGARTLRAVITDTTLCSPKLVDPDSANSSNSSISAQYMQQTAISVLLTIPIVLLSYVFDLIGPPLDVFEKELRPYFTVSMLIEWVLATAVLFGIGWPLFVSAYRGMRYQGIANFDVLVTLSATVAYGYSVASSVAMLVGRPFDCKLLSFMF